MQVLLSGAGNESLCASSTGVFCVVVKSFQLHLKIFYWLAKQREVHAAVAAVFHEVGMSGEIVVVAMLEHEYAAGGQQILS